eukprot:CAMPEP_0169480630 /NCGR_PEP_ID=MMETSP1042-20121227/29672_1 /TAXON_ID=464988 /ORGANISM="Hemiselmis andersenii, Strain CCMP1180" /LENGTH=226 /DNA_ID=CAMNT_0009595299 /DNA_START=150 /DNA_END=826 /DNA_ORIENTATION=+
MPVSHRLRAAIHTAGLTAVAVALAMAYRHRKGIRKGLSSGVGSVRRTASNVNDLLFSSTSLASSFAKDLKSYLYGDSGQAPKSFNRLIQLLCSEEVQRSIHGTSQTLLAAFLAARRKEKEIELTDAFLKSAAGAFLNIYLSLPPKPAPSRPSHTAGQGGEGQPQSQGGQSGRTPAAELAATVIDRLTTPQGRQLVVSAVAAFATAASPAISDALKAPPPRADGEPG